MVDYTKLTRKYGISCVEVQLWLEYTRFPICLACSLRVVFKRQGISDVDNVSLHGWRLKRHGALAASMKKFDVGERTKQWKVIKRHIPIS